MIVMQRLHQLDLTGHVTAKEPGQWTVVSLPMEADEHERHVFHPVGWWSGIRALCYKRSASLLAWWLRSRVVSAHIVTPDNTSNDLCNWKGTL